METNFNATLFDPLHDWLRKADELLTLADMARNGMNSSTGLTKEAWSLVEQADTNISNMLISAVEHGEKELSPGQEFEINYDITLICNDIYTDNALPEDLRTQAWLSYNIMMGTSSHQNPNPDLLG